MGLRSILNRRNDPTAWMGTGIFVGMVGFWLQSGLEWAFRQTYLTVEFFMLAGFLAALPRVAKAARAARKRRIITAGILAAAAQRVPG